MLTQITLEKKDHYQYGESFTLRFDFNGEQSTISINEMGFNSLRPHFGEPAKFGQFKQDEVYTLLIPQPVS